MSFGFDSHLWLQILALPWAGYLSFPGSASSFTKRRLWYIHAMEYYSARKKKKKTVSFAEMWMDPEGITQSEV